jgi:hypothetical protein
VHVHSYVMSVVCRGAGRRQAPAKGSEPYSGGVTTAVEAKGVPLWSLRLLGRIDTLTADLVRLIRAEDLAYGRARNLSDENLRRSCHDNLTRVLQTLADAVPPDTDPWDAPRATGRERAEQGIPLEAVLHAYRLGEQVIWDAMVREAGAGPESALRDLVEGAADVWRAVDRYATAVATAYRSTEKRLQAEEARRRQALVSALVAGRGDDPDVAADAFALLELPPNGRYLVVAAAADGRGRPGPVRSPERTLAAHGLVSVWSHRGEHEVGIVHLGQTSPEAATKVLASLAPFPAGVSPAVNGLANLGTGYQLAVLALACNDRSGLSWLDDRLPEALVVRSPDLARRLIDLALRPLLDLDEGDRQILLETLQTWLATGGSPHRAAAQLYCHRNTVLNRLRRIEALTGRSLADPRQYLIFSLALAAHRLVDE